MRRSDWIVLTVVVVAVGLWMAGVVVLIFVTRYQ